MLPLAFLRLCVEALWETWLNIHTEQRGETDALIWSWRKRSKCKLKATTKHLRQEMRTKGEGERGKKEASVVVCTSKLARR